VLRHAAQLYPADFWVHSGLGSLLAERGKQTSAAVLEERVGHLRAVVAARPQSATAHNGLGVALYAKKDLPGAIACYHKALDLDSKLALAHGALGQALLAQGAFQEARAATQKALQLLPPDHPFRPFITRQLQDCQRLLDLDTRLSALLAGDDQPNDTAEQLTLADLCLRYKKRYAAAARFYANAFAAGAAQSSQRAYNAACAAALATAGKGEDAAKLDAKDKTRLRQQALAWLKNALKIYGKLLEDPERRDEVRQRLQHWQKDPDVDSVRGKEALATLPEAERAAWQQLWSEVEKLLKKTQESTK
jgi:tetratricopeptide (TPR) repeat protein